MADKSLEVIAEGFNFLEGPRWHEGKLWVSDMWGQKIYTVTADGQKDVIAEVPNRPSGLNFLPDGSLVTVSMADRKLLKVADDGGLSDYADLSGIAAGDVNDSVVDADGNIYVGNFGYDLFAGEEPALAKLARVDISGNVSEVADGINFPNGSVITPDGATLVVAETWGSLLTAFDRNADGSLSNRRVWAQLGERTPDGICLDSEGAIWVSCFVDGEFIRVKEGGEILESIPSPGKRAVACNLGGANGTTLFALTFEGEVEDIAKGLPKARIETVEVEVPTAGSP
ncbi:MAG: SMP-30/gluconolactonase/LRE family protein [Pseudomonadota bacterium]